jgi:hypothetical protein
MIDHHLWRLRNRHKDLTRLLRDEERRPHPDPLVVEDLRRRKAQVEDEILIAEAGSRPADTRFNRQ